ncbi:MAG: hypothetical protein JRF63_12785, partial [Deltaproteobacteria bacterium]|nr:hypothetical protein [Deltaproteobacteria bacterium]
MKISVLGKVFVASLLVLGLATAGCGPSEMETDPQGEEGQPDAGVTPPVPGTPDANITPPPPPPPGQPDAATPPPPQPDAAPPPPGASPGDACSC